MRKLVKIFNKQGIRGSFNAEVMQQSPIEATKNVFPS